MTKKISALVLGLALLVTLTGMRVLAQTSVDPETRAKVQERLQSISTELKLTDEQKQQLKPILQSEIQQLQTVNNDASLSPEQKQAKAQEIHQAAKSQMAPVLTPDQQKKLADMKDD